MLKSSSVRPRFVKLGISHAPNRVKEKVNENFFRSFETEYDAGRWSRNMVEFEA